MKKYIVDPKQLDEIYAGYNYENKSKKNRSVRVYAKKIGIYTAAEIIPLHEDYNFAKIQSEYSQLGYATKIRKYKSIEEVEDLLFKEYFIDSQFYQRNSSRYSEFERKQVDLLPDGSKYEFINVPYDYIVYDNHGELIDQGQSSGQGTSSITKRLLEWIDYNKKPVFIIVEAAAGFGKTCTTFELLKELIALHTKLLPFFTELSKNRDARVFRHILQNEIETHFPEGIKSSIVINEIKKGNIPLLIDGFDELLSKDLSKTTQIESNVGNMLSTIMELLVDKSKVLITSRKTAIFDSEAFNDWAASIKNKFIVARYIIREPDVEDWLGKEKLKLFTKKDYDIDKLSNPVILTYLRNINVSYIDALISSDNDGLFRKYFEYLLEREKIRQNLLINIDDQIRIFRSLAKFMVELDFRVDTKEGVKDFFRAFCKNDIENCLLSYPIKERPSVEDLIETLSNHVFLDRKEQGFIGFINDFIFGSLVAETLILDEFKLNANNSETVIGVNNCNLAVESFKINTANKGRKLWELLISPKFQFMDDFYFLIDITFMKGIKRKYENLTIEGNAFYNIEFMEFELIECQFFKCKFVNCQFNTELILNSTFQNCSFRKCKTADDLKWDDSVNIESCKSDNSIEKQFERKIIKNNEDFTQVDNHTLIQPVLDLFHNDISGAPKHASKRKLLSSFTNFDNKDIVKVLKFLISKGYLYQQGEMFFISREGRTYYKTI